MINPISAIRNIVFKQIEQIEDQVTPIFVGDIVSYDGVAGEVLDITDYPYVDRDDARTYLYVLCYHTGADAWLGTYTDYWPAEECYIIVYREEWL
jgi:hypothetical protein